MRTIHHNLTVAAQLMEHDIRCYKRPSNYHLERATNYIRTLEELLMAAKNTRNARKTNDWQGEFIDIRLLADEKEAFSAWVEKLGEDLSVEVGVLISNGWKTSITWDERNVCFIAASTMKDEDDRNYNCVVSSRSENFYEALALNAYKINILHKNTDLRKVGSTNNWG